METEPEKPSRGGFLFLRGFPAGGASPDAEEAFRPDPENRLKITCVRMPYTAPREGDPALNPSPKRGGFGVGGIRSTTSGLAPSRYSSGGTHEP